MMAMDLTPTLKVHESRHWVEHPSANSKANAVKLRGGPVEDVNLRGGVVFDDLVVGAFDVGVADGDSADHSWAGPVAAFR